MDIPIIQLVVVVVSCAVSVAAFVRSGSRKSIEEAKVMGRLEEKMDTAIKDLNEIKKQNLEYAKSNTGAEQKFKTLFSWKEATDERLKELERR